MTEADWQKQVVDLARLYGWRCAHFRPARTADGGWRTAVQYDGEGWPDLTLVRGTELIFAELKADRGRLSPAQRDWQVALSAVAFANPFVEAHVWRPRDFHEVNDRLARSRQKARAA